MVRGGGKLFIVVLKWCKFRVCGCGGVIFVLVCEVVGGYSRVGMGER